MYFSTTFHVQYVHIVGTVSVTSDKTVGPNYIPGKATMALYKDGNKTMEGDLEHPQEQLREKHFIGKAFGNNGYWDGTIAYVRFWEGKKLRMEEIEQVSLSFEFLRSVPVHHRCGVWSTI